MFNPLNRLTVPMLQTFLRKKIHYLVSQSYPPGQSPDNENDRIPLLFTHYADHDLARIHFMAIPADRFRAIINLQYGVHFSKMLTILAPDSSYHVFIDIIQDKGTMNRFLNGLYPGPLEQYIRDHTSFDVRNPGALRREVNLVFGKWYVQIEYGSQQLQIPLEEVERLTIHT